MFVLAFLPRFPEPFFHLKMRQNRQSMQKSKLRTAKCDGKHLFAGRNIQHMEQHDLREATKPMLG